MELVWTKLQFNGHLSYVQYSADDVWKNRLYVRQSASGFDVVRVPKDSPHEFVLSPTVPTMDEAKALFITLSHLEPEEFK